MVQTATHNFRLALAMSRAFAPRIRHGQEGTMASTSRWPQPQQLLKIDRNRRHLDLIAQRALVQQSAKNWRCIGAMESSIDSAAIG
jgi:hypothetical protein